MSIGIIPETSGVLVFCIGITAMSEISRVITSSLVCISESCLLPITRNENIIKI